MVSTLLNPDELPAWPRSHWLLTRWKDVTEEPAPLTLACAFELPEVAMVV